MTSFTVVYDACVLYPAPLRDLLMPCHDGSVSREMDGSDPCGMDAERAEEQDRLVNRTVGTHVF